MRCKHLKKNGDFNGVPSNMHLNVLIIFKSIIYIVSEEC